MSRLFLFFVTAKATHIYYWCICKIAAIYFMTTFILLEYYKLESRGRFILPILYSEKKIQIQESQILSNCKSRLSIPKSQILNFKSFWFRFLVLKNKISSLKSRIENLKYLILFSNIKFHSQISLLKPKISNYQNSNLIFKNQISKSQISNPNPKSQTSSPNLISQIPNPKSQIPNPKSQIPNPKS